MAQETWNEIIKNEDQLNDLSKEELIGVVKTLLNYAKHSDEVMTMKDEDIETLNVCCKDYKSLYNEAKPYLFAYSELVSISTNKKNNHYFQRDYFPKHKRYNGYFCTSVIGGNQYHSLKEID